MREHNYHINNVDIQICAAKPKLANHKKEIAKNIAVMLDVKEDQVSVKACSFNGLGIIGEGKGIKSIASVLLETNN